MMIRNIFKYAACCLLLLTMNSCSDDSDMIDTQTKAIVKELTSRRAAEGDYTVHKGVYRFISGTILEESERYNLPILEKGDNYSCHLSIYTVPAKSFSLGGTSRRIPFFTNDAEFIQTLIDAGYDLTGVDESTTWPREPIAAKLGDRSILKAVEDALPGCELGDVVSFFLTSNLAYGDKRLGAVAEDTPLEYEVTILSIDKN